MCLCNLWLLIISHYPVKFVGQRPRGSEHIKLFISHMTLYNHVIERLCDFVGGGQQHIVTISLLKVEI